MSLNEGTWKLWREAPGFHQRYTGVFSEDGNRIMGAWEKSADGSEWLHDFDLSYIRTSNSSGGSAQIRKLPESLISPRSLHAEAGR